MQYRTLGSDLTVSAVGLGCMGMSHAYGAPADKKEMTELLAQAVHEMKKQGVNINQLARNINAYPDLISMTAFEPFQRVFRRLEDSVLKLYEKVVS